MTYDSIADYSYEDTQLCERILVTVLGSVGPWRERLCLVGGLVPRYLIGAAPEFGEPHIGSGDVDVAITLLIGEDDEEAYRTLAKNLKDAKFRQTKRSFAWTREIDGKHVVVEFICETTEVESGKAHRIKTGTGSKFTAFNVSGAESAFRDSTVVQIEAERLDGQGQSSMEARVSNLLPFIALKITAFQDRHHNKDSYDLVWCLRNWPGGIGAAIEAAGNSPVLNDDFIQGSLRLLRDRFAEVDRDGPSAYALFLGVIGEDADQEKRTAVALVQRFVSKLLD